MSTIAVAGGFGMKAQGVRNDYSIESRKRWLSSALPFPLEEYEHRLERVRRAAKQKGLDAVIIHGDSNEIGYIRWISNFRPIYGTAFVLVPTDGEPSLVSDSVLHGEPMHSNWWMTWIEEAIPARHTLASLTETLVSLLTRKHLSKRGTKLGWAGDYGFPEDRLKSLMPDVSFQNFTEGILAIKSIKSPREVSIQRKNMKITSNSMQAGCEAARAGLSEAKIAGIINGTMMSEGAHDLAFYTMVVSGARTGLKHSHPTNRKLRHGDMVYIDMGSSYFGYSADMSRTFTVGRPNEVQKSILDLAYEIHRKTVKMMKPGALVSEIADVAYSIAKEGGFEPDTYVGGHGLGTTLFDRPVILPGSNTKLEKNMIFAYEPMIVPMEVGTAVVEDDYLVTDSGVERLTKFDQKLW